MATIFWLSIYEVHIGPSGEYDWTMRVWQRCGYFEHLSYSVYFWEQYSAEYKYGIHYLAYYFVLIEYE